MKQFQIILGLILFATVSTFAQSPRIKLNQITKDTVKGSVLISNPTDSGMVYSRDFYIAYGADTVAILYGDTLAATSDIISSVLSDGVTITGDGTTGNELKVDTATVISTIQGLVDSLANYVTIAGTETISGAKTFTNTFTQSTGDANFDSGTLFVDASENRVGIGTSSPSEKFVLYNTANSVTSFLQETTSTGNLSVVGNILRTPETQFGEFLYGENVTGNIIAGVARSKLAFFSIGAGGNGLLFHTNDNVPIYFATNDSEKMRIKGDGEVYIAGTTDQGAYNLQVNGTGVWGAGAYVNGSDRLIKENIQSLNKGLDYIKKLNPVQYNYKSTFSIDQSKQLGFIAQDVMVALKDVSDAIVKDNGNYLSMAYQNLIPITVKAIQEQQAFIETQEQKITDLETTIQALITRIVNLENK